MFKGFTSVRASLLPVVFLRRIARALSRANDLTESRLALDYPAWYKANKDGLGTRGTSRQPKVTEIFNPSVEHWNSEWEKKHPEEDADDY